MVVLQNRALMRALNSISHPITMAAMGLLWLNGHWLQAQHPSWITGKLGDLAWLVFAPLVCATLLALLVPRLAQQQGRLFGVALVLIGGWFVLGKTNVIVNELTRSLWNMMTGRQGTLLRDPTDLLTMPGILVSAFVWHHASDQPRRLSRLAWLLLALGAFASVAYQDSGQAFLYKQNGVSTVCVENSSLVIDEITDAHYEPIGAKDSGQWQEVLGLDRYISVDGGLNWIISKHLEQVDSTNTSGIPAFHPECSQTGTTTAVSHQPQVVYEWQPGQFVERSADGGQNWTRVYDLSLLRQGVRLHRPPPEEVIGDNFLLNDASPGPRSGVVDPRTGNVVLAMGWDGALVGTPDGTWHWVAVGPYRLNPLPDWPRALRLLAFDLMLAVLLLLAVVAATLNMAQPASDMTRFINLLLVAGLLGWLGAASLFLPPYFMQNNVSSLDVLCPSFIFVLPLIAAFALILKTMMRFSDRPTRGVLRGLVTGSVVVVLYLIPHVLWTQGIIDDYQFSMTLALVLTVPALLISYGLHWRFSRRVSPPHLLTAF